MCPESYSSSPTRVIRSPLTSWTTGPIVAIPMESPTDSSVAGLAAVSDYFSNRNVFITDVPDPHVGKP